MRDPAAPSERAPDAARKPSGDAPRRAPLPIVGKPWFWLLFVGVLFSFPLIKGLGARLPDPPPGIDTAPLHFELPDDTGRSVTREDLAGHLLVITELAYLNVAQHAEPLKRLRELRKRLRGLGSTVVFVVMTHGASAAELADFVDQHTARKPQNVWLVDDDRAVFSALCRDAGAPSAQMLLLDTHGRLRALYGEDPAELDELVGTAGILANWRGADPAPGGTPPEQTTPELTSDAALELHQLGYSSPTTPIYTSWDFTRALEFLDTRSFKILTAERQADGALEHFEWSYSTSFDIQSVGSRESQFLYLSGQDRSGGIIVEEWEFGVRLGERSAQRSSSTPAQPIGTSTPYSSAETFIQGGSLGNVESRRITAPVQRKRVVVTHEFPFVRLLGVDPEGRFLMVLGGNQNLYQIGLLGADRGSVTPILDSSVAWPFADPVWFANCWISRVQHATQGRLWILGELPRVGASDDQLPTSCVILADAENDGVFEQHHVVTWAQAVASGFVNEDHYIDTFDGSFD